MSRMRPILSSLSSRALCAALAFVSGALAAPALFAEVSVVTDARGRCVRTVVVSEMQGPRRMVWSPISPDADPSKILNPDGDRMGDSAPVVAQRRGSGQPWVVWSASDGADQEIAFATWYRGRWHGPLLLDRVDNSFDDRDPQLAFDAAGRPVAVWWRNEPIPQVYLSVFTNGSWTKPLAVSDPTTSSRFPSLRISGSQAVVSFYTHAGQSVIFQSLTALTLSPDGSGPLDGPVPPPDFQYSQSDNPPPTPGTLPEPKFVNRTQY
jgi:hypothetical protein